MGILDNVLQNQYMSITMVYDTLFKVAMVIWYKGKSTRQVALKTIMNIGIHVILKILLDSFGMGKKILKEWKGVHIEVKVL